MLEMLLTPCLGLLMASAPLHADAQRPPSIVLVLADDLGYGEVGCFGQTHIPTPAIDAIAADGAKLTAHWAGSPVCAPSRCVLLTGKHPGHAEVRGNWGNGGWGEFEPEGQYPMAIGSNTLGDVLKRAGYATSWVGKWGNGGPGTCGHPNRQGFDHFFGYLCQRAAHNYYPTHLWRNDTKVPLDGNDTWYSAHQKLKSSLDSSDAYFDRFTGGTWACDAMIDEADAWMREQLATDTPFLLVYASPVPHLALQVPPDRLDQFNAMPEEGTYNGQKGYLPHPRPRAAYAAMISSFDAEIGRLMQTLEDAGAVDNTIVVITSDNGPSWVGGVDMAFFNSQGGLRGRKAQIWEGGLRVPTVVRWPGHIEPGTTNDVPSGFEDWLPTFAGAAGVAVPEGIDGIDLSDVLAYGDQPLRALYREFAPAGAQAVRVGRWKGVRPRLKKGDLTVELYDLSVDAAESNNVAAEHPEVVRIIEQVMASSHTPSPVFPLATIDE